MELQTEGDLWSFDIFFHFSIITPRPGGPVAHSSLVQVYNLVPDVLDSSLVSPIKVERLEWPNFTLWTGVLCAH